MRGTDFEFRHRSWFIILIFALAFGIYAVEPVNAVQWLLRLLGRAGRAPGLVPRDAVARAAIAVGAVLVGAAALIRTWGTAYLKDDVVRDSVVRADRVVADGPYRYVRNPLYLGNMLMAAGLAPLASPVGSLVLVAGTAFFLLRLIGREEAFLLEKQGDAYRAYTERVPRLWPALAPRLPAGDTPPRWGQAWAAEMWLWILFAACVSFTFTLDTALFDYVVWGGFALYLPVRIVMKRRSGRRLRDRGEAALSPPRDAV